MLAVATRVVVAVEGIQWILFDGRGVLFALAGRRAAFLAGAVGHVAVVPVAHEHVRRRSLSTHPSLGRAAACHRPVKIENGNGLPTTIRSGSMPAPMRAPFQGRFTDCCTIS